VPFTGGASRTQAQAGDAVDRVEKYIAGEPGGYRYLRFCELYPAWEGRLSVTMRPSHAAGDKLFVDYAGDGVVIDRRTGERADLGRSARRIGLQGRPRGFTDARTSLTARTPRARATSNRKGGRDQIGTTGRDHRNPQPDTTLGYIEARRFTLAGVFSLRS
jgi:hypothetical protein